MMASAIITSEHNLASEMNACTSATASMMCDGCRKHGKTSNMCKLLADTSHDSGYKCIRIKLPSDKRVGKFHCNICLGSCQEPVITMCGHLFCRSCLYSQQSLLKECPVCRANVQDKVIPLYGQGKEEKSDLLSKDSCWPIIRTHQPCRPSATRSSVPVSYVITSDDGSEPNHGIHDVVTSDVDGSEPNHGIHYVEIHTIDVLFGFLASLLEIGCITRAGSDASVVRQRRRFNNKKEFVLHWAFIIVASIASIGFFVC